jgi:hypothetical protein
MKVISSIDKSREGNDCYVYESWSLVEIFVWKQVIIHNCMNTYHQKIETNVYQINGNMVDSEDPEVQFMFETLMKKKELES